MRLVNHIVRRSEKAKEADFLMDRNPKCVSHNRVFLILKNCLILTYESAHFLGCHPVQVQDVFQVLRHVARQPFCSSFPLLPSMFTFFTISEFFPAL